jgi:signal transduction histidine kinase
MRSIFPPLKSKPRFPLDLTLLPAGIILLEISVTLTELLKIQPGHTQKLLFMRLMHAIALYAIAKIAGIILKHRKIIEVSYTQLFVLGVTLSALSELARRILASSLDVVLDFSSHRFLIVLVHGLFWIPVLIIVGGRLTEIFSVFKDYEKRLLIKTRIHIRTSASFKGEQELLQDEIRKNLVQESNSILELLNSSDQKSLSLSERNNILQPHLKGINLRALSLRLEKKSESDSETTVLGQNLHSLNMLAKQFSILYKWTAKKSPLSVWVYTILSTVLVAPPYINFFTTFLQLLASWPPLILATYLVARLNVRVLRSNGKYSLAISNLLIILIGFLPSISNKIGQLISPNTQTSFSFWLSGVFFAIGYYFYIRFLQITQPEAISSISNDDLEASPTLERAVSKTISEEFDQAISHRWAIYIHGKILTRLAATSLKLEQALISDNSTPFDSGLEKIKSLLSDPTREFDEGNSDVQTEVDSRLNPWEGLINLNVHIDPALAGISNPRVRDFGEAIEEIISNSVRHGGSQNITVNVTQMAHPDVLIRVEDDAIHPLPLIVTRIGLGTRILNLVSDGRWTIKRNEQKTTLEMTMSLLED